MPYTARRCPGRSAADQARERRLVAAPDPFEAAARGRREARLVLRPAVLVEVDPAGVRRDLDEPRPEAGAADVDVAQSDLARDERQPVLVLLPAHELPGGEEHHRDHQDEQEPHDGLSASSGWRRSVEWMRRQTQAPATVTRSGEPRLRPLPELMRLPRRSPLYPELARALAAADALHVLRSDLEPVPVRPTSTISQAGCYRLRKGDPVDLRVSRRHGRVALSFLHELGHFFDHQLGSAARPVLGLRPPRGIRRLACRRVRAALAGACRFEPVATAVLRFREGGVGAELRADDADAVTRSLAARPSARPAGHGRHVRLAGRRLRARRRRARAGARAARAAPGELAVAA